jgi:clan AA aspartic protease
VIYGHVRDKLPRLLLSVSGPDEPLLVEFVVDTGFDGALALPASILSLVDASLIGNQFVELADKTIRRTTYYAIEVDWGGEQRLAEAMLVEGRPLLGYEMMEGCSLQIDMSDGGDVSVETA